jgi:hypothetical protein
MMRRMTLTRRHLLERLCTAASAALAVDASLQAQGKVAITVYKTPTCGCCKLWVDHMNASGFAATVKDMADVNPIKRERKVAQPLWSCHTAIVGGYIIEGHVPAADVKKLLAAAPKGVVGLTIPGMPQSAPGMDIKPFQPYTVLSFDANGKTTVFAEHKNG